MQFNSCKFEKISYNLAKLNQSLDIYLANDGSEIEEKETLRDLGIIFSKDGTFTNHINKIIKKSKMKCAWILRVFQSRHVEHMMVLWKSLLRSILEYCSQLWCPTKIGEIQKIEDVQTAYTKRIPLLYQKDYHERLKYRNLYTLGRRRERYCIIYIYGK